MQIDDNIESVVMPFLKEDADERVYDAIRLLMQHGDVEWINDVEASTLGVYGLVDRGTKRAYVVVYSNEGDFELDDRMDEWEARVERFVAARDVEIPKGTEHVVLVGAHYWAIGNTLVAAKANLRSMGYKLKDGYIVYTFPPGTADLRVDEMGRLMWSYLDENRPVLWSTKQVVRGERIK